MVGPRLHILVVDDDAPVRRLVALVLAERYRVTGVEGLAEACVQLQTGAFDLALTDSFARTPEGAFEGLRVLRRVAPAVPIALLTAHRVDRQEGLAHGFCDVIRKPFDIDVLLDTVQGLIAVGAPCS